MQRPVIFFDHVRREVVTLDATAQKLADFVESQRRQVVTSGRPRGSRR